MDLDVKVGRKTAPEKLAARNAVESLNVRAVNSADARVLYKAREPIYPKLVSGRFRALKWGLMAVTLAIYYLLPWLRWDRGPHAPSQAVLVDFPNQRFYFFFIEIWPQEIYYITGLLILAALVLFLVTALFGRVWCGYTCPQTVWTDLFIAVERLVEGDRNRRIRLAREPWSASKVGKKLIKHSLWLLIAAMTGGAWVLYFHDAPTIIGSLFLGAAPLSAYFFLVLLTLTTYTLAGFMREQVCTYMCPWPRIQGAMIDEDALSVTYRVDRGEPRGPHKRGQTWEGRGHCIDCRQCVAACPMGIDIRDGEQLECINCALCIDACDDVMGKVGLPRGLIAYDTTLNIERRRRGEAPRFRLLRPRTLIYAALCLVLTGVMLGGLANRSSFGVNVLRDRNPPFVRLSDGSVRNAYTVKILNKTNDDKAYRVFVAASSGYDLRAVGFESDDNELDVVVTADSVRPLRVFLTLPPAAMTAPSLPVTFNVEAHDGGRKRAKESVFLTGLRLAKERNDRW